MKICGIDKMKTNTALTAQHEAWHKYSTSLFGEEYPSRPINTPTITKLDIDPLAVMLKYFLLGKNEEYDQDKRLQAIQWLESVGGPDEIGTLASDFQIPIEKHYCQLADDVRNYYKNKLSMAMLKGVKLTDFRKELYKLVTQPTNELHSNQGKILYKLPEFYHEDVAMDKILENAVSTCYFDDDKADGVFTYLGVVDKSTKHCKEKRYWFKNTENKLATIYVDRTNNTVAPLIEKYLICGKEYHIVQQHPLSIRMYNVIDDPEFTAYYLKDYSIDQL